MKKYNGVGAADGQSAGVVLILDKETQKICQREIAEEEQEKELQKLEQAREDYCAELENLKEEARKTMGKDAVDIFGAYHEIAGDDAFFLQVGQRLKKETCNIEYALQEEMETVVQRMTDIEDPYIRERASDIKNVCEEIQKHMYHQGENETATVLKIKMKEETIVVAKDLTPADTVRLDNRYLKGFITERGGKTSHTVILAKTLGIPAVVGAEGILELVEQGERIYMNGTTGEIIAEPDRRFLEQFAVEKEEQKKLQEELEKRASEPAITKDGHTVKICVNTGDPQSVQQLDPTVCDGVGLYRTEFLYMEQAGYPSEEAQFKAYRTVAEKMNGKEVVIRTLDIGGDKQLDYMRLPKEDNPFLGYRAIRICLEREEMFLTQLRALLRASSYGTVSIMFPMIVTVEEVRQAKIFVKRAMEKLDQEGTKYDSKIRLGIMIETPAAVLLSDCLAKEVDFFSIGTNDLIQYTTATDRMNDKVQYLYDNCNISVLRAVNIVIRNAHRENIPVSICGEAAADERLLPLWVGMGVDKLSMTPVQTARTKQRIRDLRRQEKEQMCQEVLGSETISKVRYLLET